jgi:DNA-directed RNA polymerases I and III subunit RPAC2
MSLQITISFVLLAGEPAKDVLKDALQDLMVMCQHLRGTFDNTVTDYRSNKSAEQMDIDPKQK